MLRPRYIFKIFTLLIINYGNWGSAIYIVHLQKGILFSDYFYALSEYEN